MCDIQCNLVDFGSTSAPLVLRYKHCVPLNSLSKLHAGKIVLKYISCSLLSLLTEWSPKPIKFEVQTHQTALILIRNKPYHSIGSGEERIALIQELLGWMNFKLLVLDAQTVIVETFIDSQEHFIGLIQLLASRISATPKTTVENSPTLLCRNSAIKRSRRKVM